MNSAKTEKTLTLPGAVEVHDTLLTALFELSQRDFFRYVHIISTAFHMKAVMKLY